jgi:hypothetical protein
MTKIEWREQQRKLPFEEKLRILEDLRAPHRRTKPAKNKSGCPITWPERAKRVEWLCPVLADVGSHEPRLLCFITRREARPA